MKFSASSFLVVTVTLVAALISTSGCASRLPNTIKNEHDIEFAHVGGQSLRLDIYSPKKTAGKLPVVVWIHGGSWNSGDKNFCPIGFMAA